MDFLCGKILKQILQSLLFQIWSLKILQWKMIYFLNNLDMKWNTFIRDIPMYTLVEFFFVIACFITLIWPIFFWWLCFVVDYIFVNICKFYLIAYLSKILLHFLLAYNQFLPRTIYRQCIVILSTLKVIYKKMMWQCTDENWSYASNCIWE